MSSVEADARAALYIRVSTARQADEGLSLAEQQRRGEAFIAGQQWQLQAVYVERGVSGRRADRPALARLIANLDDIDVLVIPKLDRLGRSTRHLLEIIECLERHNVRLVSLTDSIDTNTSSGRLLLRVLASVAEFEADLIAERTASVSEARAAQGRNHGRTPFGYCSVNGHLVVNESEAKLVQRMFANYIAGHSQQAIARAFNQEGLRTQRGGVWHQGTIAKVLRNRLFLGEIQFRGDWLPGEHAAIIDVDTFAAAAKLLEGNAKGGGSRGRRSASGHLFHKGMLSCGLCGGAMIPRSQHAGAAAVYHCLTRRTHGVAACPMTPVKQADIDRAVFAYFESEALDTEAMRERFSGKLSEHRAQAEAARNEAQRETAQAIEAVERIRRDYKTGVITAADWRSFHTELAEERSAAEAALARADSQLDVIARQEEWTRDATKELFKRLERIRASIAGQIRDAEGTEAVRAALRLLFEGFTLHRSASAPPPPGDEAGRIAPGIVLHHAPDPGHERIVLSDAALWLEPKPRRELLKRGLGTTKLLRRAALDLLPYDGSDRADNDGVALLIASLLAPIEVIGGDDNKADTGEDVDGKQCS